MALGLNDIEILYHKLSRAFASHRPSAEDGAPPSSVPTADEIESAQDWPNAAAYLTATEALESMAANNGSGTHRSGTSAGADAASGADFADGGGGIATRGGSERS